ncbi:MAG: DEAD/DEAH box helicase, partial [Woeseiaceae bacterium]
TLRALRTPGELLHEDIRSVFGQMNVIDLEEALAVQPATLQTANTVLVATMQAFKQGDAASYRVYRQNGALMPHFDGVRQEQKGEGSLADVIRLWRPFVVVDEAHNQGTPLASETLRRFDPSCILELTATPDRSHTPSNVLRSVSAATLQAEDMLKLPLELAVHPDWRVALREAIERLKSLGEEAAAELKEAGERIRPVMLIQAERRDAHHETFTPDRVKQTLIDDFKVSATDIAIATGAVDELGDRRMTDPDFPRFIITVDKLREGWDCPFAYVLFTFRGTTSATAVEQVLGRVLRMPFTTRKKREALNRAYAFAVSDALAQTVTALKDGLVHSGFERMETNALIRPVADAAAEADLLSALKEVSVALPESGGAVEVPPAEAIEALPAALRERIELSPENGRLTVTGALTPAQVRQIADAFPTPEASRLVRERLDAEQAKAAAPMVEKAPSETGARFSVPLLAMKQGGFFEVFDQTPLVDAAWELNDFDVQLGDAEFATATEAPRRARLEVGKNERIGVDVYDELAPQLTLFSRELGWTVIELVHWLDRNLPFPYADQKQKVAWINAAVTHLMEQRKLTIEDLAFRKFRLRSALERKMAAGLNLIKQKRFEELLGDTDRFALAPDEHQISFVAGRYAYDRIYAGTIRLKRHFFPVIGNLKSQGEEFECAEQIANHLPGVKHWVRNVERKPGSFWLQTSSDRFYPDFMIEMEGGVIVAVEYKGADRAMSPDSVEKKRIGELWAARSGGRCRFAWVENRNWAALRAAVQ